MVTWLIEKSRFCSGLKIWNLWKNNANKQSVFKLYVLLRTIVGITKLQIR